VTTHSPQISLAANRVNEILRRLRERGHRLTPQRYAVVRALVEGGEHPSAEQLFQRVSDAYPMMSPATVYKTLDTLKAAGEVLELEFREGPNRYDANIPTAHPHVVCTRCGRINDVMLDQIGPSIENAAKQSNYQISGYRLDFYGLCPNCAGS
jgi:Fur family transcriptional regulator, peroxide stress response regulator